MRVKNDDLKSDLIKSAVEKQFDSVENSSFGLKYLIQLNPTMIIFFLKHMPNSFYKVIALEKILYVCPGLIDGWLMLGSVQDIKKAHQSLEKVVELDPTNVEAHLMIANILIKQVNQHLINLTKFVFNYYKCKRNLNMNF